MHFCAFAVVVKQGVERGSINRTPSGKTSPQSTVKSGTKTTKKPITKTPSSVSTQSSNSSKTGNGNRTRSTTPREKNGGSPPLGLPTLYNKNVPSTYKHGQKNGSKNANKIGNKNGNGNTGRKDSINSRDKTMQSNIKKQKASDGGSYFSKNTTSGSSSTRSQAGKTKNKTSTSSRGSVLTEHTSSRKPNEHVLKLPRTMYVSPYMNSQTSVGEPDIAGKTTQRTSQKNPDESSTSAYNTGRKNNSRGQPKSTTHKDIFSNNPRHNSSSHSSMYLPPSSHFTSLPDSPPPSPPISSSYFAHSSRSIRTGN